MSESERLLDESIGALENVRDTADALKADAQSMIDKLKTSDKFNRAKLKPFWRAITDAPADIENLVEEAENAWDDATTNSEIENE